MSKNETKPVSRKRDIVVQELDNEILIYDLNTHKAFSLNKSSAMVWQACNGNNTITEISNQISRRLNSPVNEDFVWLALDHLKKENLIENESEFSLPFEGLSRREVVRKIGLTSVIALPIISSIVAPTPAYAQSCAGIANNNANLNALGCPCQSNNDCLPGLSCRDQPGPVGFRCEPT